MTIEYSKLEQKIYNGIKTILSEGNPSYNEQEIKNGIKIFLKVIRKDVHPLLNDINKFVEPNLNKAFILEVGEIEPLSTLSDKLEAFLKKVSILCTGISFTSIDSKNLVSLFKYLNLNRDLSAQTNPQSYPELEEYNLNSFIGKEEYLYSLCLSRVTRNLVSHNAPTLEEIDIINRRNHLIAIYIYTVLKFYDALHSKLTDVSIDNSSENSSKKFGMLYDFITFGRTTSSIKEEIISSFILHHLKDNPKINLDIISEKANEFFEQNANIRVYEEILNKCKNNRKVSINEGKYELTDSEYNRIEDAKNDFKQNHDSFKASYQDIISKFGLNEYFDELLDKTTIFFEKNYSIDFYEAIDKGIDLEEDENDLTKDYYNYLKQICNNDNQIAEDLFVDILDLCNTNDYLIRISASQIFTNLTNSRDFQHYIDLTRRIVYLDTQIILYALLYEINEEFEGSYENIYFKITKELINLSNSNDNIELNLFRTYLGEVSHHIRRALALIPYESITGGRVKLSNNVFYEYYWWGKNNEIFEEDYNFSDFMKEYFELNEEDIFDRSFKRIVNANIIDYLNRININVPNVPRYSNAEIEDAKKTLEDSIRSTPNSKEKHGTILKNDALMVCHLSDKSVHPLEPIFLTWDKSFTNFRKKYIQKFSRTDITSWHLFNPSKFINHIQLLKMKIDPKTMTNDFLSIMDGMKFKEQISTIYDTKSKLIELSSSNSRIARKNISIFKDIFEKEFGNEVENSGDSNEALDKVINIFEELLVLLVDYLQNEDTELNIDDYKNVMKNEAIFKEFSNILIEAMKQIITDENTENQFNLLIDFLKKNKENV